MITRKTFDYTGVIPILATPFHDDERLDLESLARSIAFNARVGVSGVTVLGLLGESNRLTDDERAEVVRAAVDAAGKLPVIVGTSHTGTVATIRLAEQAMKLGATALMITPSAQPVATMYVTAHEIDRYEARALGALLYAAQRRERNRLARDVARKRGRRGRSRR